jgi:apolipoprotein N-acyltransferase
VTLAAEAGRRPSASAPVRIGIAQGNFLEPSPGGDYYSEWLRTYVEVSREAFAKAGDAPLDLLLWPEGVCPDELLNDGYTLPVVQRMARESGTPFFIGTRHTEPDGEVFTSAALIGRDGTPRGRYDKVHVVPVGEWFPFRPLLAAIYLQYNVPEKDLLPGRLPNALDLARTDGETVRMGTMICYDVAFPWEGRAAVRRGARFFAQLTSDSPFENTSRPEQHADLTALRCAETRRWMVRCAVSGISQVVDATGREISRVPVLTRRAEIATVPLRDDTTLYVLWGEWFVGVCGVVVGVAGLAAWRGRGASAGEKAATPAGPIRPAS